MARQAIYLDHNASAPLLPEARDALVDALSLTGNPSSVHNHGRLLRNRIEAARDQVAALAGAERTQVVFTGSATEAITQAIVGAVKAFRLDRVVVSAGEHSAVLKAAESAGVKVTTLDLDENGIIRVDQLAEAIEAANAVADQILVAVHAVNNETGVVQPLARIEAMVGSTPHYLFVDAVQALGKLPLEFASRAPDMMAVSAHKIGGPAGVGALLVKGHADAARLIPGGGQESGRRGGTESAPLIAAFGAAAAAFPQRYDAARVSGLARTLEEGLFAVSPVDTQVFGAMAERAGNVVDFAVPGLTSAVAMMGLDLMGISVSSGSACSSGKVGPSHVLAAMGVKPELAACALRVSLGWNSTEGDVNAFLDGFEEVLGRHRARQGRAASLAAAVGA
jgi:cysteine desulfurase